MTLPYRIGIGLLLVALMFGAGYVKGKRDERINTLQSTVEAYEKRKGIDNAVSNVDTYDLCIELGGVPDECAELRRLDEASEGK